MKYFRIRKIRINIIIPLLQHDSVTSGPFILQMENVLTVCMLFHCLNHLIAGGVLPQKFLIIAGNNDSLICNNNRSIFLDKIF